MNDVNESNISVFKKCKTCRKVLSACEFYTKGKGRLESYCKVCSREKKVKAYQLNKSKKKLKSTLINEEMKLEITIENYKLKILRSLI